MCGGESAKFKFTFIVAHRIKPDVELGAGHWTKILQRNMATVGICRISAKRHPHEKAFPATVLCKMKRDRERMVTKYPANPRVHRRVSESSKPQL
jgi:hypothetical protein